jgi:signal transduction histidine kinase
MADPLERSKAWKRVLEERFQPMSMDEIPAGETSESRILEEGLSLETPARNDCPALRLHLRDGGRSLFSQSDLQFVESLQALLGQTLLQRSALEDATRAERQRIGEDLHDDLGSRLLMLIHRSRNEELVGIARDAMADLRSILSAIDGPGAMLADTLADCRAEAAARCEAAGTELSWQQTREIPEHRLSAQARSSLERCLRELITNALKHARPAWLAARVDVTGGRLWISLRHPWSGEGEIRKGRGLRGIERRMGSLSGRLSISIEAAGQLDARLELPL